MSDATPAILDTVIEMSPTIGKWAEALAAAQAEMENAEKNAKNPHFNSSFADLAEIINTVRLPLAKHGIARHQAPVSRGDLTGVRTMLAHSSGEYVAATVLCKPDRPGAQALGSVITYLRRYSLAAACGIAQEDDDGNAATGTGEGPKARRSPPPVRPAPGATTSTTAPAPAGEGPKGNGGQHGASPPSSRSANGAGRSGKTSAPPTGTSSPPSDDPLEDLRRTWCASAEPDENGVISGLGRTLHQYAEWMSETFPVRRKQDMSPQMIKDAYALTAAMLRGPAHYTTELAGMWAAGRMYGPAANDLPEAMGGQPGPKVPA